MYTLEDLEKDARTLTLVMQLQPDYKSWFTQTFPNGAESDTEVLTYSMGLGQKKQEEAKSPVNGIIQVGRYDCSVNECEAYNNFWEYEWAPLGNSDIEALGKLPNLVKADIGLRGDVDFSPLAQLPKFRELNIISYSPLSVGSLQTLQNLSNLRVLSFSNSALKELSELPVLPDLKELSISQANVRDSGLLKLQSLKKLQSLALRNCGCLDDISPLFSLPYLQELDLLGNMFVTSISGISALRHLSSLCLSGTGIKDLTSLQGMENLRELEISMNNLENIDDLLNIKHELTKVKLTRYNATDTLLKQLMDKHIGIEVTVRSI